MTVVAGNSTCAECGRPFTNWQSPDSTVREAGLKVEQHAGSEDRLAGYRAWRYRLGVAYVNDVPDQLEYDRRGRPVAALELTRCDRAPGYTVIPPGYLNRVWERFTGRDRTQYRSLMAVAKALGIPGFLIVFEADLDEFHIREVGWDAWVHMNQDCYRDFLKGLRGR